MENKGTKESLFTKAMNETKKPGFLKALSVFFVCSISGIVVGFIFDAIQMASTIGIGMGLVWMGVAYFDQKNKDKQ